MILICTVPICREKAAVSEPGDWCTKHYEEWVKYIHLEKGHRSRTKKKWMKNPVKHRSPDDKERKRVRRT